MKIAYILNDAAFFVSHRLPLALSVIKQGGEVVVITGKNINKALEDEAISTLEKYNISLFIVGTCIYTFLVRERKVA